MKLRVAVITDEFGRPIASVLRDVGPAHGAMQGGGFHGTRVVGEHGNREKQREWARANRAAKATA